jgi:hypothetical protein
MGNGCIAMSRYTTESRGRLPLNGRKRYRWKLEQQLELGREGMLEEDGYLAEWNLGDLKENLGTRETYWLLAVQAAQEASRLEGIRTQTVAASQEHIVERALFRNNSCVAA